MKVSYIYPPLFKPFYPMATRILTENLLRNPNLKVDFSAIPVTTYQSGKDQELYDAILSKARSRFHPNVVRFMEQKYMVYNVFYVFMAHGYFDSYILEQYDTDIQIVSVLNFCDLLIVKHLLQMGKKVVLGGAHQYQTLPFLYPPAFAGHGGVYGPIAGESDHRCRERRSHHGSSCYHPGVAGYRDPLQRLRDGL
ncbi:MAG: hypothetical protein U5R49_11135 [Deltaproteobacteria bacterium]|nr:hypothetical protein [Deltaproteobacteria bacterium]